VSSRYLKESIIPDERETMRTYERPAMTAAGSFEKVTGLAALGLRETLVRHQLL
jgi:hypothetical protein